MTAFLWLFRPLRLALRALTTDCSARQLALGFALGLVIGLVPKGNLIAVSLTVLLFATRVNLGVGLLTAMGVSALAPVVDPLLHGFGWKILTHPGVQTCLASWYERPLIPWTDLDNTVVAGGLALGLVLFYPAYHLSRPLFERYHPRLAAWLMRYRVARLAAGGTVPSHGRAG